MLVLGVGGLVGEAWMTGFLAGMEERTGFDLRGADAYVGTSAGSMILTLRTSLFALPTPPAMTVLNARRAIEAFASRSTAS